MAAGDSRYGMWQDACALIDRAERLHRQFFRPASDTIQLANWEPPIDVFETEGELWIVAALPGVEPEDLDVSLGPNGLAIRGTRRLPAIARGNIHRLEIPYGRFERRIALPAARLELDRSELSRGCLFLRLSKRP
jgi:HSP20 family protein